MTASCDVFATRAEFDCDCGFSNKVSSTSTDDMDTQDAICPCICQDFDSSFDFTKCPSSRVLPLSASALLEFYSRFLQLLFGFTNRRDFWMRIDDGRDAIVVEMGMHSRNAFHTNDGFVHCLVRKHCAADKVTNGIDTRRGGLVVYIDGNETSFVGCDACHF